jgi:hypothetical protein
MGGRAGNTGAATPAVPERAQASFHSVVKARGAAAVDS